jgi:hypothetical protein
MVHHSRLFFLFLFFGLSILFLFLNLDWDALIVRCRILSFPCIQLLFVGIQFRILVNPPKSPGLVSPFPVGCRRITLNDLGNPIVQANAIFAIPFAPTVFRMAVHPAVLTEFVCLKWNEKYGP